MSQGFVHHPVSGQRAGTALRWVPMHSRMGSRRRSGGRATDQGTGVDAEWAFWRAQVRRAVAGAEGETPCLMFALERLAERVSILDQAFAGLPIRHWWSFKTLPLMPAVRWWREQGRPVEVVSEFELQAVLSAGVPPEEILVNGPAKHTWLVRHPVPGLRVNLDSVAEASRLAQLGRRHGWRLGLRLNTRAEENFEYPGVRTQFGLLPDEVPRVLAVLRRARLEAEVLHFHLRTNVGEARCYREAAEEALGVAAAAGWRPAILDLGGGFPPERVLSRKGTRLDAGFSLASLRRVLGEIRSRHRSLREFWMENGRWLTAPAGVLMVTILDIKEGRGFRTLICDGGRTLQAMVATWERHVLLPLVRREGSGVPTLVCGPTCMAFDNLGVHPLPAGLRVGDRLIWLDAGAYQMSWETRFSHGLSGVLWMAGDRVEVVRRREPFGQWLTGR